MHQWSSLHSLFSFITIILVIIDTHDSIQCINEAHFNLVHLLSNLVAILHSIMHNHNTSLILLQSAATDTVVDACDYDARCAGCRNCWTLNRPPCDWLGDAVFVQTLAYTTLVLMMLQLLQLMLLPLLLMLLLLQVLVLIIVQDIRVGQLQPGGYQLGLHKYSYHFNVDCAAEPESW